MAIAFLIEYWLTFVLGLLAFGIELWALSDCLRRPAENFVRAGKRTKGFWTGMTVGAALVGLLGVYSGALILFQLAAVCIACVYLADVKPEVKSSSGGYYGY